MNKLADSQTTATIDAQRLAFFADFAGKFNMLQNTLVLVLQMFVVSRIFRHFGVGAGLFILPVIAPGGYALAFALPVLAILKSVKVLENSTDYSINNTARRALFLPTSREAKYKAKNAIDTFVARTGDMFSGILVLVGGLPLLTWNVRDFALINILLVLLWLAFVAAIVREHKKLSPAVT
jgi:AAA family ATP:ADP antiporter